MPWVLEAFNTDSRYRDDIRYREYTTSEKKADLFGRIPKIQFTDSGHGIVFSARHHSGPRLPRRRALADYVREQTELLQATDRSPAVAKLVKQLEDDNAFLRDKLWETERRAQEHYNRLRELEVLQVEEANH